MKRAASEPNHERVFTILRQAGAPMTAYEVLDAARKHKISAPPTVYRALKKLIDEGRAHRLESINARIPAGRWGAPADFVGATVFLASRASAYVAGETLVVDGGWMGR